MESEGFDETFERYTRASDAYDSAFNQFYAVNPDDASLPRRILKLEEERDFAKDVYIASQKSASGPAQQVPDTIEHVPITSAIGLYWQAMKTSLVAKFAPRVWHQLLLIALTIATAMINIFDPTVPFWVKTVFFVVSLLFVLIMSGLNEHFS